jgi:hypothetical protein
VSVLDAMSFKNAIYSPLRVSNQGPSGLWHSATTTTLQGVISLTGSDAPSYVEWMQCSIVLSRASE